MNYQEQHNRVGKIFEQYTKDRYLNLLTGLGEYYLKKKDFDRGLRFVLDSLALAIKIRSGHGMLKSVELFGQYRRYASDEVNREYKRLYEKMNFTDISV
ncbi:hypothetical protein NYE69_02640 [Paenibacillus sp. FSL R5-0527]|uniref:hypothetical protein n=1 Tax=Paenibacillus sp. FSL R5-0527 TaxID=2975321 RepID=UPI0026B43020